MAADALDVLRFKARRGQRQTHKLNGIVAVLVQRPQRAVKIIPAGAESQFDRLAFQLFMEGTGIQIARALVEQRADHVGNAGLFRRILAGATGKRELQADQRHRLLPHQPSLESAGADDPLDRHRLRRSGDAQDSE